MNIHYQELSPVPIKLISIYQLIYRVGKTLLRFCANVKLLFYITKSSLI